MKNPIKNYSKILFPRFGTPHLYILNPIGDWHSNLGELQKVDFRGLEFASAVLSRRSVEQIIPTATLRELLHDVDQFYEEILNSEIHWEAKYFILGQMLASSP